MATTTNTIRLATSSPATRATTKETLADLERIASRAASSSSTSAGDGSKPADILLLPEAYLGGYPRGSDFGCKVGGRTPEGRDEYLRYFKGAVDLGDTVGNGAGAGEAWVRRQLPGDEYAAATNHDPTATAVNNRRGDGTREELERIARETGVFLVVGVVEKAGGSLYCAVVYVCPRLGVIGKRRKVLPTGSERLIWAQGSPATLKAVTTVIRGVRINLAAAICWENYMPLLRQSLYAQNINLYLAPTADARDAWLSLMRTVAIEGRCFVVSSNMAVREGGRGSGSGNGRPLGKQKEQHKEEESRDGVAGSGGDSTKRRSSCLTEDGFEIALPNPDSGSGSGPGSSGSGTQPQTTTTTTTPSVSSSSAVVEDEEDISTGANRAYQELSAPPPKGAEEKGTRTKTKTQREREEEVRWASRGGSAIVSPLGDVLAGPQWEDESGIIYADVDFDDCIRGRLDLDAAGSYSRNDSFRLEVRGLGLEPLGY
ncbi:carbon-nitrogen hydrolase [Xylariomycetidae sp. FL2044]|nr:carbon-nitrogen hydrolase [Xylariomycetidae sp. FL2044]